MSAVKLSDDFFKVPKLLPDLSNWIEYRDRLQWALDAHGLLPHLKGTVVVPKTVASAASTSTSASTQAPDAAELLLEKEYRTGQALVKQAIAAMVPASIFSKVKGKEIASDVWNALVILGQERSKMVAIDL